MFDYAGGVTRFVEHTTEAGTLFLPEAVARGSRAEVKVHDGEVLAAFARSPRTATDEQCLEVLAAVRRGRAGYDAVEAETLARLDAIRDGDRYVADEAALELRVSRHHAADRLERAEALTRRLPGVLELLREGVFEGYVAGRIAAATALVDDDKIGELDVQLCAKVRDGRIDVTDPGRIVRAARRLVEKVDPEGQLVRARRAREHRKVELLPGEHGMSTLLASLPAEVAASAYARVDALARKQRTTGDTRNLDQLRADVTAALLLGQDPGGEVPAAAAMVYVHVPVAAALMMSDQGCELDGFGPIPAAIAREMMTNPRSVLRKVITDTEGMVTGVGAHARRPNTALVELIRARDRECDVPGCHRPARFSDLDHLREHHKGGPTAPGNLCPRCEHHHYLKDHPDWWFEVDPATRVTTVHTPAGRTYRTTPDTLVDHYLPTPDRPPHSPLWTPGRPRPKLRLPSGRLPSRRPPDRRPRNRDDDSPATHAIQAYLSRH